MKKLITYLVSGLIILFLNACGGGGGSVDCEPDVSTPTNLTVNAVSPSSITLDWVYSGAAAVFNIYRDGIEIRSSLGGTSFTDSGLLPNTNYCYQVTAENLCGESSRSNTSCVTTPEDTVAPTTPNNLVALLTSATTASLYWDPSNDNSEVEGYKIYRNGTYLHSVTEETTNDTSLSIDTEYCYTVTAYDYTGNESTHSNVSCLDTSWTIENIDEGTEVSRLSLVSDTLGNVHISFYDKISGNLRYATNKTGSWVLEDIDYIQSEAVSYNSIAIDSNGNIHISYRDNINEVLKYATNKSGSWSISVLDDTSASSGNYNSITLDALDKVHISYYSSGLSYITDASGSWVKEIIDNDPGHSLSSISVSPSGHVHITYYSFIDLSIKYITNLSGNWITSVLTSVSMNGGNTADSIVDQNNKLHVCYWNNNSLNYLTNMTGSWIAITNLNPFGGKECTITVSNGGDIHIAHQREYTRLYTTYRDLVYTTNASSEWKSYTLDSSGAGWYNSISLDSSDKAHIGYMKLYEYSLNYATNKE